MDVSLTDDDTVSVKAMRLCHTTRSITVLRFLPVRGVGSPTATTSRLEVAKPLHAYDIIEVGKSRLLFLPLCGENFRWDDEEQNED